MKEKTPIHFSVVIPVYGCRSTLIELYHRLLSSLGEISKNFEIILVNDGSPDDIWNDISKICKADKRIKGINLSRNFGQHHALSAGLDHAKGTWVVVMDCDLQDPPEEIYKLYDKAKEGYDIVLGKRLKRKDTIVKKTLSNWFYGLLSYLADTKYDPSIGTFRILSSKVVESYRQFNERLLFFGAMINWLGFRSTSIEIKHVKRISGRSSYNFRRKISLAITGILSFSDKPLKLAIRLGVFLSLAAFLFILFKVLQSLAMGTTALGWSSLIAAVGFSTGLIVTVVGIVGLYVGSIFKEVKQRPKYICSEMLNFERE